MFSPPVWLISCVIVSFVRTRTILAAWMATQHRTVHKMSHPHKPHDSKAQLLQFLAEADITDGLQGAAQQAAPIGAWSETRMEM